MVKRPAKVPGKPREALPRSMLAWLVAVFTAANSTALWMKMYWFFVCVMLTINYTVKDRKTFGGLQLLGLVSLAVDALCCILFFVKLILYTKGAYSGPW